MKQTPPRIETPSISADEMFHATIAEVAGYPGIWTLIQQVKVHVDRYRRLTLPQAGADPARDRRA